MQDHCIIIRNMLQDEAPRLNWDVKHIYDAGYRIRAFVLIHDIPYDAVQILDELRYEQGEWLNAVTSHAAYLIAGLLLKKVG